MEAAFSEIDRLSGLLSRYDHASAVYDLNTHGHLTGLPPEVALVVASSLHYHKLTGGYFDVTVKPVVDLFQQKMGGEKKVSPTDAEINDLLKLVDARNIEFKDKSVSFKAQFHFDLWRVKRVARTIGAEQARVGRVIYKARYRCAEFRLEGPGFFVFGSVLDNVTDDPTTLVSIYTEQLDLRCVYGSKADRRPVRR